MAAQSAQQFLAGIQKQSPATKTYPGYSTPASNPHPVDPIDPKSPISPSELDALYAKGSVNGPNAHTAGLKAIYEAGVAGKRA